MLFSQGKGNQLRQRFASRDFRRHGLNAEFIGENAVKITRDGIYVGQLRKVVGSYCWYPNGFDKPQYRTFSPDQALTAILKSRNLKG